MSESKNVILRGKINVILLVFVMFLFMETTYLYSQSYRGFGLNQDGKWELIDEKGNVIGNDVFERVDPFNNGIALVTKNGRREFIDKNGNTLSNGKVVSNSDQWAVFKDFNEGIAVVKYNSTGNPTWIDSLGNIISLENFDYVSEFVNGLAIAKKEGDVVFGYINTKGEWAIQPNFVRPNTFVGELAVIGNVKDKVNDGYFYINKEGQRIKLPDGIYPFLFHFAFSYTTATIRCGRFKNIDQEYEMLWPIINNLDLKDEEAGLKGYINATGEIVVPCQYSRAHNFYYGRAIVRLTPKSPPFIINSLGEKITDKIFETVADYRDGLSLVKYDGKMAYIDLNGEFIETPSNLDLSHSFHNGYAIVRDPELGFNFIDTKGTLISKTYFKNVKKFGDDFAAVLIGEHWGVIDGEGKMVIEPRFQNILELKRVY